VDVVTTIFLGFGGLFVAAMGKVLSEEINTCLPLITRWLLERAVLRIPVNGRQVFANRVVSKIQSWPGKIGRFCIALWLVWESRDALYIEMHDAPKDTTFINMLRRSAKIDAYAFSFFAVAFIIPLFFIYWEPYVSPKQLPGRLIATLIVVFAEFISVTKAVASLVRFKLSSDLLK
jgi:hypothetical protein